MIFRHCTEKDFENLLPLFRQLWPEQVLNTEAMNKVYIDNVKRDDRYYLCAETNDRVVGFCSLSLKNSLWQQGYTGHIDELIVDEEFRRKGVGKELLERIIEIARNKKCCRIELDSAHHRVKAHRFYLNNGFENRANLFSLNLRD